MSAGRLVPVRNRIGKVALLRPGASVLEASVVSGLGISLLQPSPSGTLADLARGPVFLMWRAGRIRS